MAGKKIAGRGVVMVAVFIATFMTSVEVTIVTTALPSIISSLHGLAAQSWIMSAYLLTMAITTPIYGKLADSWGRQKIFQWGVVVFTLGSLFSGLAPNMGLLIAARALQGIGAGAVMPLTFTIIADYYDFQERAKVLAFNNTAWALSALVGPMIGGFLVDNLSWHWVFFVNVPLGILVFILIQVAYRNDNFTPEKLKMDTMGIVWLSAALISLLLGVEFLASSLPLSFGLFVVTLVTLYLFIRTEKRVADPLISPKMFANRTFSIQIATTTILSGVLMGYEAYFPIWLQALYRVNATKAGLVVTSSSLMWLVASFFVGALISHFIPKKISLFALTILLISYFSLCFASLEFPIWLFYVIAMVNGACIGTVNNMNLILAQQLAPAEMMGSASSIVTLGRSLGQTVMNGVYGTILNIVINATRGSIPFAKINEVISSSSSSARPDPAMAQVILNGLHGIYISATVILVICWLYNMTDPLKEIVKE
ncbi:MFS transporter [Xylocopilactobacillus apicola]|uniref:MFS transporter n=1 Tax=Xylocopilactobacillus apicola TaxID=2932184 RepID=A0AAU9DI64_9LACO|nr:MFS transporter [Xylocopilactobacillus apicola]BDR58036.1 MFS transporter [Xylocopilactobacillus apicola]